MTKFSHYSTIYLGVIMKKERTRKFKMSPLAKIALCFVGVIIVGCLLLKLPFSVKSGQSVSWVDAFFLSTSAVCVTGLTPVPNVGATLSGFGQSVMAGLIQIGGLGFVTLAVFFMVILGAKVNISQRNLVKEALNQNTSQGMVRLVLKIVIITFSIEFIGMIVNTFVFLQWYGVGDSIRYSVFHTISAFNNAGFEIFGLSDGLISFADNIWFNLSSCILIILGGLGFIVIYDIIHAKRWKNFAIHTKIVLKMTAVLLVVGTLLFKLGQVGDDSFSWLDAIFQSVTCRTAGFTTIDMSKLSAFSIMIGIALMFLGAAPCSTGGGVKVTTAYVITKSIASYSRGKRTLCYKREISSETKLKAFLLLIIAIILIFFCTLLLLGIESFNDKSSLTVQSALFEVVSAFGTTGLSLGITPTLHWVSKLAICVMMFFGRVGALTMFSLLNRNLNKAQDSSVTYLEEKIIIG